MKLFDWETMEFADGDAKMIALAASAAAFAVDTAGGVVPTTLDEVSEGSPFRIPLLIPEEVESGDGRRMEKDALTTRDLPISLLWQPATGDGHNGSYIVGRIDTIERVDNGLGNARGVFDTGPYGKEAERLVGSKMLRGVSADLDKFEATVDGTEMSGNNFQDEMNKITAEKITVNSARVMAATLVPKPAFQECTIELVTDEPEEGTGMPDGVYEEDPYADDAAEVALSTIAASAAPVNPPSDWFNDPELNRPTPLTVDDNGHVYGHIATWETNHIGYVNQRVNPPRSRSGYAYFRTGLVRTEEGGDIAVGQLTLAGGHAPLDADAYSAVKHYDDTASAVADVTAGEDSFGIWVAGGLRPGVTPDQVRILRASAPSGDWRPVNNSLELVAICQVNVPGFPIARARVASGSVMALVAAGAATLQKMRRSEMELISDRVNSLERHLLDQKRAELQARVAPLRQERINRMSASANAARAVLAPELQRRAERQAELTARAEELRAQFKTTVGYTPGVAPFEEDKHPRNNEGKFRKVLGRLTDLLKTPDAPSVPGAEDDLRRAADAEESGDMHTANKAAGDAATKIETAAESAGKTDTNPVPAPGDIPGNDGNSQPKARLGQQLHDIATEIADVATGAATDAGGAVDKATGGANDQIPEEFKQLLQDILDQLGEGIDPVSVTSRMDGKLKHWLEGKGFQDPKDLANIVRKLLQRPIQPGIAQ